MEITYPGGSEVGKTTADDWNPFCLCLVADSYGIYALYSYFCNSPLTHG